MLLDVQLNWTTGDGAAAHDVYFGTNFGEVNDANTSSGAYRPPQLSLGTTTYDAGLLESLDYEKTYYWRIDEVNGLEVWKGDVWHFTTVAEAAGCPDGDLNDDCEVNFKDMKILAYQWLTSCAPGPGCAEHQRRFCFEIYAIFTSRKGVLVRHMACSVTASFRASATLALRGPVLPAIVLAQQRSRVSPSFRQKIAFAAS